MPRFCVSYRFNGTATETIEAESLEAAQAAIEEKVDDDNFDIDADEIDGVDFYVQQMHPVTRDGSELWVTYIRNGDVRGHPSALLTTPLFSPAVNDNQEAALSSAVAT